MTYKPIKTEEGWGVMLKDGKMLQGSVFKDAPWLALEKADARDQAKFWKGKVVRLRVTYEIEKTK